MKLGPVELRDTLLEARDYTGRLVQNKYQILRKIGQGGMGSVYEAQHAVVGRRFALKFLHPELAARKDAFVRFRREAQAAGALDNEHIAAVNDFDVTEDGAPYIVMEYLVGESLAGLLEREGPLPVPRAVALMLQICRGLEAAHAAGIVHRDLKPDNLFLARRSDGSELVKILDFGIAKLESTDAGISITNTGARMGTPFYMAPEQARGSKNLDHRVDIHALGVVLYELLSDAKPHPGDSYNAILAHIISEPATPLASLRAGLPEGLVRLVHRALALDPGARPASVREFARELAAFGGQEIVKLQSQFELRVASHDPASGALGTATGGAPGTASAPARAPAGETTAGSVLGTDGAPRSGKRRNRVGWVLALLALAAVVALWNVRRLSVPVAPSAALRSEPAPPASEPASESTSESAKAPEPAPTAATSGSSAPEQTLGRPAGRPRAPARAVSKSAGAASSAGPRVDNPAISPGETPAPSAGRRVTFDTNNPYQ